MDMSTLTRSAVLAALDWEAGTTVLSPEMGGPGSWVGGPSAVAHDGAIYLAYRLRRPVGEGRGYANVIARTVDGVTLETLAVIDRDRHRAESLERPCLVRMDEGKWRLYISCATPNSKHWRVDLLEAEHIRDLPEAPPVTVLPGDDSVAVKDPVILRRDGVWHLWASCHPLDDPSATDRMTTEYATSPDGVKWNWQGTTLGGGDGWDRRGVRFAALLCLPDGLLALYDGRATEGENWEERSGAADSDSPAGPWVRRPGPVFTSPYSTHGLRYLTAVRDPSGPLRVYYEGARPDGSHELRTQLLPPWSAAGGPADSSGRR